MAKLLKIDAAVTAHEDKAAARYGMNSKAKCVIGTITSTNGRGRSQKWVVYFPTLNKHKSFHLIH